MTIRAPFRTLYTPDYRINSYEREVFFETLGCCWALNGRNVSGEFCVRLVMDLSGVELLYGCPMAQLSEELVGNLVHVFGHRPRNWQQSYSVLEDSARALLDSMNVNDFLNFNAGFQDGVRQVLEDCNFWTRECETAFLSLKFYANNLVECDLRSARHKGVYASLLSEFMQTCHLACCEDRKRNPLHY